MQGLPRSNHNAGSTGRLRSVFRQRGFGGVHEDGAVELVHFPAGVVDGESEWSRRSHPHKVRRKSEVFCGEGHGLHRPVAREKGSDEEAEDRDPTVHRQNRTELTGTHRPASIQCRHISSHGCRNILTAANKGSGALVAEVYTASCSAFPALSVGESLTLFFRWVKLSPVAVPLPRGSPCRPSSSFCFCCSSPPHQRFPKC